MEPQEHELKSGLHIISGTKKIILHSFYNCEVLYAPEIASLGLDMARKGTRKQLFSREEGSEKMDWPSPWYPEARAYAVCQIKKGSYLINKTFIVPCVYIYYTIFQVNKLF